MEEVLNTSIVAQGWSAMILALQRCNERLASSLSQADWEGVQSEVVARDHLLRKISPLLRRLNGAGKKTLAPGEFERIQQILREIQETGDACIEALRKHSQELSQQISRIHKGRTALNLYHAPRSEPAPRFLDRKG